MKKLPYSSDMSGVFFQIVGDFREENNDFALKLVKGWKLIDFSFGMLKSLECPYYYDGNLDSFIDTICDLSWINKPSLTIVLSNVQEFVDSLDGFELNLLIKITDSINEFWKSNYKNNYTKIRHFRMILILESDIHALSSNTSIGWID